MKILNQEHFENVRRYAESIGDTSLQECLDRLKSWEENPSHPCEISLYYDHAPYSFGFTRHPRQVLRGHTEAVPRMADTYLRNSGHSQY